MLLRATLLSSLLFLSPLCDAQQPPPSEPAVPPHNNGRVPHPVLHDIKGCFGGDNAALDRAVSLVARAHGPAGPYVLQAAIAACHARARTADTTDWAHISERLAATVRATVSTEPPGA